MPAAKQPNFIYNAETSTITDRNGVTGTVVKNGNGYAVHLQPGHNLTEQKQHGLESRMRNWYYYTHIKENK